MRGKRAVLASSTRSNAAATRRSAANDIGAAFEQFGRNAGRGRGGAAPASSAAASVRRGIAPGKQFQRPQRLLARKFELAPFAVGLDIGVGARTSCSLALPTRRRTRVSSASRSAAASMSCASRRCNALSAATNQLLATSAASDSRAYA